VQGKAVFGGSNQSKQ